MYRLRLPECCRYLLKFGSGMETLRRCSVGIVIIGDEILKGQVKDTNSNFLCRELYSLGLTVRQIAVVKDDLDMIAEVVNAFSRKFSFVITSGGIGPTHDDVTYEGVARAFGEGLMKREDVSLVINRWCEIFGIEKSAAERMELVPKSSQVHMVSIGLDSIKNFPLVSVKNVYIYPGIPSYLERLFANTKHFFTSSSPETFKCSTLYCSAGEFSITGALNDTVKMFEKRVRFGSYPATKDEPYRVRITLEADDETSLQEAEGYLRSVLPQNCLVGPEELDSEESINAVYDLADPELKSLVNTSIGIIEECFNKYTPDSVFLSFNGGKDCTVLLHLVFCVLNKLYGPGKRLKAFYVQQENTFQEIDEFVNLSENRYNLIMYRLGSDLKPALFQLLKDHPELKAVLIGTRRTDPRSLSLQAFQQTDAEWPSLMRCSPLLDWNYHQIWHFLRTLHVPYCSLYDQGYTSLGSCNNTERNPKLQVERLGRRFYQPAYLLKDPSEEREGRC